MLLFCQLKSIEIQYKLTEPHSRMEPNQYPMSLRLPADLHQRLAECAARLKIKRHTLAQNMIEAAIAAIEKNGYRLSLPIQFRFQDETGSREAVYPQGEEQFSRVEERGPKYQVKGGKAR
jgi:predicted DNA-binding protein